MCNENIQAKCDAYTTNDVNKNEEAIVIGIGRKALITTKMTRNTF